MSTTITPANPTRKILVRRYAKGPITIDECSEDGKYIQLSNTSNNKNVDLTGWNILRKVDNGSDITYKIPSGVILNSGKYVRIHAGGQPQDAKPDDLTLQTHDSWSLGINAVTQLFNEKNEEKSALLRIITRVS